MNADLRIQLTALPGLDPVGLVLHHASVIEDPCLVLMVHAEDPEDLLVVFGAMSPSRLTPFDEVRPAYTTRDSWLVDFTDASTRDQVARWMAPRAGLEVGCLAGGWRYTGGHTWILLQGNGPEATPTGLRVIGRAARSFRPRVADPFWRRGSAQPDPIVVEGLAGLDPGDDTRLPDGSRVVDAVALGRVAVHLGSLP